MFTVYGNPALEVDTNISVPYAKHFFRRKLSKLDFDLHFCIMTSVWDFSNPPIYWMIS